MNRQLPFQNESSGLRLDQFPPKNQNQTLSHSHSKMTQRRPRSYPIDLTMPILVFIGDEPEGAETVPFEARQVLCLLIQ